MFRPIDKVPPLKKSMPVYMRNLLKKQDSLRKAAAKELLRTDLFHMTHKKQLRITNPERMYWYITVQVTRLHVFIRSGVVL